MLQVINMQYVQINSVYYPFRQRKAKSSHLRSWNKQILCLKIDLQKLFDHQNSYQLIVFQQTNRLILAAL